MNKNEIINVIWERTGLQKKDCVAVVDAFLELIPEKLSMNDDIRIVGFGTFSVRERAERTGINPRTKEMIKLPASKVPVFKAGKKMKESIQ